MESNNDTPADVAQYAPMVRRTVKLAALCIVAAVALWLLTGCNSERCASNPKEARAQGLSCWRDENGTTYRTTGAK
jgi:hypothetical protein